MLSKFIGDKLFYKKVLMVAVPIMIQNGITNLVNMLDNIMVGQTGTIQMTGVAVTNQLLFVFNLCIFGAISGAGIFGAQYYGKRDFDGIRHTFRFKIIFCTILTILGIGLFLFFGEPLVMLYLKGEGSAVDSAAALGYAREYMLIMMIGLIPYSIAQCYSGSLRDMSHTVPPMIAGISAVIVNLALNYVLIFGHFGAPALGVRGAAIATVISRFVELLVVMLWTHLNAHRVKFIVGAYRSLYIPFTLIKQITIKGLPLMVNETMWAAGIAAVNQCYSARGIDVVAANNISQTFFNVFSVAFMAVGLACGIILGQQLGAGGEKTAMDTARKLITFSVFVSIIICVVYASLCKVIPLAYNTSDSVRGIASGLMFITALTMPLDACVHASYFALRSGGKTFVTFLFDSGYMWLLAVPVAFILVKFTALPILPLYAICQALLIVKCAVGIALVASGTWIKNIMTEI